MGKSAPSAPDPAETAKAQAQANEAAARVSAKLNRPDTYGPGGSVTYGYGVDGDQDHAVQYTTLSKPQQNIYDAQQSTDQVTASSALDSANRMAGLLSTPLDTSDLRDYGTGSDASMLSPMQTNLTGAGQGLATTLASANKGIASNFDSGSALTRVSGAGQGIQSSVSGAGEGIKTAFDSGSALQRIGVDDFSADRTKVEDAIMSRLTPQNDRDRASMEARLSAQGFTPGTAGYKAAADEINRTLTDQRMQAVLAGGQEQSRLFGQTTTQAGFNNNASSTETEARNNALTLANQAQAQGFGQEQAAATLQNDAQAQGFGQLAQSAAFGNTARTQELNEQYAASEYNNSLRQQQLAEKLQLRAAPINETSALFGLGNGVQVPQAAQVAQVQVGAPDYQGLVSNNYKSESANAAAGNAAGASAAIGIASAAAIAI